MNKIGKYKIDLAEMAVGYDDSAEDGSFKEILDINRDGIIDLFDLVQISRNID